MTTLQRVTLKALTVTHLLTPLREQTLVGQARNLSPRSVLHLAEDFSLGRLCNAGLSPNILFCLSGPCPLCRVWSPQGLPLKGTSDPPSIRIVALLQREREREREKRGQCATRALPTLPCSTPH